MTVCLQSHSWWSLLEGVASPAALVAAAHRRGVRTLALTDTNSLHGAIDFVDAALMSGVRPVVGVTLASGPDRLVLLASDPSGWSTLCQLVTRMRIGGRAPGEPVMGVVEAVEACHAGIHVLVPRAAWLERLAPILSGRVWAHLIRPVPRGVLPGEERRLLDTAERLRVPVVAGTGGVLLTREDPHCHRLVEAVAAGRMIDQVESTRWSAAHTILSGVSLLARFADIPQAVANLQRLAEGLGAGIIPNRLIMPQPRLPVGVLPGALLKHVCERAMVARGMDGREDARARLVQECQIIGQTRLDGYFLVVRSIARHARRMGHTLALRGSAGNSLVCYLLGITDVDPLRFDLPLARFLHPGRVDLPDIDLDFDWKVRDEAIGWAIRRFGERNCVRISAYQYLQGRSSFREACKLHGLSDAQIAALPAGMDERAAAALEHPGDGPTRPRNFPLEPERWPRLVADARHLLGRPRHLSLHPGGIVLCPVPMEEHVPLEWSDSGGLMTQLDKDGVERVGLVKIDLLGNRALGALDESGKILRQQGMFQARVPENDPATLDLVRRGDTLGVVQLESPAMRHLLTQMRPRGVDDVIESLALVRPAAAGIGAKERFVRRRRGLEPVDAVPALLRRILPGTDGMMVFEDDSLRMIQGLTGWDDVAADRFRKRVAKHRNSDEAEVLHAEFMEAVARSGLTANDAETVWLQLAKFNKYSFCKSHAVSYGLIAWRSAWLKARHPAAFWAGALNNNGGCYPSWVYVEAARRAGVPILPPCINDSDEGFAVRSSGLRVGLGRIAGLPAEFIGRLLAERSRYGSYMSCSDLESRLSPGPETVRLLVRAGALDSVSVERRALLLDAAWRQKLGMRAGAVEMFPDQLGPDWAPPPASWFERTADAFRLLGFTPDCSLLDLFRPWLPRPGARLPAPLADAADLRQMVGRRVSVVGLFATGRDTLTAQGRPMQFVTLVDRSGEADVSLFPGMCAPVAHMHLGPWLATGVVESQYDAITLTAHSFQPLRRPGLEGSINAEGMCALGA